MGIPLSLGDAVDLTDLAIQKMFLKQSTIEKTTYYDKFFNKVTGVTDFYSKDSSMSGLGEAARVTENSVITGEVPVQGYDKTYTQVEYGKLLPVTKQMWKFGIKKRSLERVVQALIAACERKREKLCAARLDNAFETSYTETDDGGNYTVSVVGGDSVAALSASHTREDGGSNWNNVVTDGTTVNMDFEYDAIKALARTASLIKDPKGVDMDVNPNLFIFKKGTSNYFRAREIKNTIRNGGRGTMPGTSNNDAAGIDDFEILALPWIQTNTAYWFALDTSMKSDEYGLQYKESQGIQLEGPNVVFKTGEIQYKATLMFDIGHNDMRNTFGSKNTNAS